MSELPLHQRAARDQASAIRDGQVSSTELVQAVIARIEQVNPSIRAVVSLDAIAARRAAEEADAAVRRGDELGPLHGVPITLKDAVDVAGLRTTVGAEAFDRIADQDATVAARLRVAGAIIVGHTNVPPFLADYQTANPIFGRTNNPWDVDRTPGGSSGGAAAAVAAGLTPIELGSDLTGSLRLPASFCGVYGLKTTEHLVPLTGFFRQPPGTPRSVRILSTLGPLARDLDDLELVLGLISGPDGDDSEVPPVRVDTPAVEIHGLRVAVAEGLPGVGVTSSVRGVVDAIATRLSDANARVVRLLPAIDWDESNQLFRDLLNVVTGIFAPGTDLDEERRSVAWYLRALDSRDRVMAAWERFFDDVDVLLLPGTIAPAFLHAEPYGQIDVNGRRIDYLHHGAALIFANFAALPALAAPAGLDPDGLPIGVQLVGPRWSDGRLISIARALEGSAVLPGTHMPDGSRGQYM